MARRISRKTCGPRDCRLRTLRNFMLSAQLVEQRLGVFQVGGVEAFGEPVVDFGEHRARLVATTLLWRAAARGSSSRAAPKPFACIFWASAIASRKVGLGQFGLAKFEPQFSTAGQRIGPEDEFLGVRLERLLDGDESVVDLAVEGLGLGQTREMDRDSRPASGLGQAGQALADQRDAFTRAAELRPRPAERRAGQSP